MQKDEAKEVVRYGGRKTGKLVRCYHKKDLGVFRVEVELHSSLLHDIATLDDFPYLPEIVYPKHLQFVAIDWERLEQYLSKKCGDEGSRILVEAQNRKASIRKVRRYLARQGVANVHRFLVPLAINQEVSRALDRWARHFKEESLWLSTK